MHPTILHFGHLTVPTFGVLAAVGLIAALQLSARSAPRLGLDPDRVWNAGIFLVLAAFLLSRLLLVATNFPSFRAYPILLLMVPSLTPLGLVLTAAAAAVYFWLHQLPLRPMLDTSAAPATFFWAFLALGHFFEGSDPGLPAARLGLRAAHLGVADAASAPPTYPVALLAAALALAITAVLLRVARHPRHPRQPGHLAALALTLTGLAQFLLTFLREPFRYQPPFQSPLDPIQWLALGMIVAATLLYLTPARAQIAGPQPAQPSQELA